MSQNCLKIRKHSLRYSEDILEKIYWKSISLSADIDRDICYKQIPCVEIHQCVTTSEKAKE